MLAKTKSGLDRWLDRHGAAVGIVLAVLVFFGMVELLVRLIGRTARLI